MVILCAGHLASSVQSKFSLGWLSLNDVPRVRRHALSIRRKVMMQNRYQIMASLSRKSPVQDSVASGKPSRLLPTFELNTFSDNVPEEMLSRLRLDECDSFYMLELSTSREFGSSLQDKNAAVLICLIDVNGDSLLQRIPAIGSDCTAQSKRAEQSLPFQSGSVDIVTFKAPKLERIKEIWIGLESGSWRLDGLNLRVIHGPLSMPEDHEGTLELNVLQYTFEKVDVLLGEEGVSVADARPVVITNLLGVSLSDLQDGQLYSTSASSRIMELKEDGMREYADLKFSLLLYDLAIVITGFAAFILSSNDSAAYSFLIGGFGGFLYLLLLQRSVDGLPVANSPSEFSSGEASIGGFSGLRRPWLILSLIMVAGAVASNYSIGGDSFELTPTELFVGTAGFLANKVAVLLAAFKPLKSDVKRGDSSDA